MQRSIYLLISFMITIFSCHSSSEELLEQRVKLTIFHSNDIRGYLTPCG